jgi:LPS-assembly lipoprotein
MSKPIPIPANAELVEARVPKTSFDRFRAIGVFGFVALASLSLSACGLKPLYADGPQGQVAALLGSVSVEPIEGKNGWLMRNALNDRLTVSKGDAARYRLVVKLDDQIEGFGVRADDTVTRERRTLRARYQLIENDSGKTLLDATTGSDAGIDVVSSEYATIAGENTALENLTQKVAEQIVTQLSIYARAEPGQ